MKSKIVVGKFLVSFALCLIFLAPSPAYAQDASFNSAVNYSAGTALFL